MKQPELYKIQDGLNKLGVMGKSRVIKSQLVCKDSLVFLRE